MTNKKNIIKTILFSLILYVGIIALMWVVYIFSRGFVLYGLFDTNGWGFYYWSLESLLGLYFFRIVMFFHYLFSFVFAIPYYILYRESIFYNFNLIDGITSVLLNLSLFFVSFVSVYYFLFRKKAENKKDIIIKMFLSIKKYSVFFGLFLIIFAISIFPYLFTSSKEERICENSVILKEEFGFRVTKKGICVHGSSKKYVCDKYNISCKDAGNKKFSFGDWYLIEDLNKDDFDINFLEEKSNENYRIIELNIKEEKIYIIDFLKLSIDDLQNIDPETFQYLNGSYSKDKNNVYYKNEIISADPETFIYEKGKGKATGKGRDKNGTWIKGALQDK